MKVQRPTNCPKGKGDSIKNDSDLWQFLVWQIPFRQIVNEEMEWNKKSN